MIPAGFEYVRAAGVDEALAALGDPDAKVIAGGLSLLPMMKLRLARPSRLVDIVALGLSGVSVGSDGTRVGALTTYREFLRARAETRDALGDCAERVGDLQVRNVGTMGGGVAHADPASDLAAGVLAAGVTLVLRSTAGERRVDAADFFVGPFTTALQQQELLVELVVPAPVAGEGSAYVSVEDPASGYPLAGAAVRVRVDAGRIAECTVGITGVSGHAFRADAVEAVMLGSAEAPQVSDIRDTFAEVRASTDVVAGADYRRHLAAVVVCRAAERALSRAADSAVDRGVR